MKNLNHYAKAVAGGLVAGLTAAGTAISDGAITPSEWIGIALAFILGTGIVYAVPNKPLPSE